MAWSCGGRTNLELVTNLKRAVLFKDPRVEAAMLSCDRKNYCPRDPYNDSPQPIGFNVTISAPHMHAMCLEALAGQLRPGARALDVGSGSGYLTACMAAMLGPTGKAVGIEHVPELVQISRENAAKDGKQDWLDAGNLMLVWGDGRLGCAKHGPYDAIHVGAAAAVLPTALVEQLRPNGRLVIPVGTLSQELLQIDKAADGTLTQRSLTGVRYVPLTDLNKQVGQ
uniref:protein-L-isoaspartate(D-aspartate) O-methyltransferase n=1 Tax=Cryptomonas curvata TaxID=233186 RepID=A0A7S0MZW5_9CRYP